MSCVEGCRRPISHDGQWVELDVEVTRKGQDRTTHITARGTNRSDPKQIIDVIRSEIEDHIGRKPLVFPPATVSGLIDFSFDGELGDSPLERMIEDICETFESKDLLRPRKGGREITIEQPRYRPHKLFRVRSADDGRLKYRCAYGCGEWDTKEDSKIVDCKGP